MQLQIKRNGDRVIKATKRERDQVAAAHRIAVELARIADGPLMTAAKDAERSLLAMLAELEDWQHTEPDLTETAA